MPIKKDGTGKRWVEIKFLTPGTPEQVWQAMATARADHLPTWLCLLDKLGLAASNVGQHRAGLVPARISGVVERVDQDTRQRYILLRLEGPAPGVVLLGTYGTGTGTGVSVCRFFYGDGADGLAATTERRWRDWLAGTLASAA